MSLNRNFLIFSKIVLFILCCIKIYDFLVFLLIYIQSILIIKAAYHPFLSSFIVMGEYSREVQQSIPRSFRQTS
jgi:hypothetical protein